MKPFSWSRFFVVVGIGMVLSGMCFLISCQAYLSMASLGQFCSWMAIIVMVPAGLIIMYLTVFVAIEEGLQRGKLSGFYERAFRHYYTPKVFEKIIIFEAYPLMAKQKMANFIFKIELAILIY